MPVAGKPVIRHIIDAAGINKAVVLTSNDPSDDELTDYLKHEGIEFFEAHLEMFMGVFAKQFNIISLIG